MSNKMRGLAVFRHNLRNWAFFDGHDKPTGNDKRATLVIGDERVFTESEVRAYEKDLMRAQSDPGHFTERYREEKVLGQPYEETVPQWVARARAIVRKAHGLSDPA